MQRTMLPFSSHSGNKDPVLGPKSNIVSCPRWTLGKAFWFLSYLLIPLSYSTCCYRRCLTNRIPGLSTYLLFTPVVEMLNQGLSTP